MKKRSEEITAELTGKGADSQVETKKLRLELSVLQASYETLSSNFKVLEKEQCEEVAALTAELEELKLKAKETRQSLTKVAEMENPEVEELEEEVERLKEETHELRKKHDGIALELQGEREGKAGLESTIAKLQEEIEELTDMTESLNKTLKMKEENTVEAKREGAKKMDDEIEKMEEELMGLREQQEDWATKEKELRTELEEARELFANIGKELQKKDKDLADVKNQKDQLTNKINDLQTATKGVPSVAGKLEEERQSRKDLEVELNYLRNQNEKLLNENEGLRMELATIAVPVGCFGGVAKSKKKAVK